MLLANRMLGPFCVSTTRKDRFASARPSMNCDTVTHSPDSPALSRGRQSRCLSQRYPGEVRVVLKHHAVDIGCEVLEFFGPLPQLRGEERGEDSGQGTECGGIGTAGGVTHQIRLVPKLDRQRKQRAGCQVNVLVRSVAAETAQEVV